MAAGSRGQGRSRSGRLWSCLELEGVSQAYFSLSMLCNEPEEIPLGTNPLPKPDQPFFEKFCRGVDRSGETAAGTASSLWKADPHGLGQEACLIISMASLPLEKGLSPIQQGRSCLQRDSPAHYESNRHKPLLSSPFSLERPFLPSASCPPLPPSTHISALHCRF